jgi:hypothetical protein
MVHSKYPDVYFKLDEKGMIHAAELTNNPQQEVSVIHNHFVAQSYGYRPIVLPIADSPSFVDKSSSRSPVSRTLPKPFRIIGVNEFEEPPDGGVDKGSKFLPQTTRQPR